MRKLRPRGTKRQARKHTALARRRRQRSTTGPGDSWAVRVCIALLPLCNPRRHFSCQWSSRISITGYRISEALWTIKSHNILVLQVATHHCKPKQFVMKYSLWETMFSRLEGNTHGRNSYFHGLIWALSKSAVKNDRRTLHFSLTCQIRAHLCLPSRSFSKWSQENQGQLCA